MTRLSATEVARRFSEVLNRVAAGEEIEVTRGGAPVAVMSPPKTRLLSAQRFRELLAIAPPVDDEFAEDVRQIRREVGVPENPWPS
jgi:prevent-host-death family protein